MDSCSTLKFIINYLNIQLISKLNHVAALLTTSHLELKNIDLKEFTHPSKVSFCDFAF